MHVVQRHKTHPDACSCSKIENKTIYSDSARRNGEQTGGRTKEAPLRLYTGDGENDSERTSNTPLEILKQTRGTGLDAPAKG